MFGCQSRTRHVVRASIVIVFFFPLSRFAPRHYWITQTEEV